MPALKPIWRSAALLLALAVPCLALHTDTARLVHVSPRLARLPALTLWAWERPENLTTLDPASTAVAYLERTLLLGPGVLTVPRRQSLALPDGVTRIAVVRLEALPGAPFDAAQRRAAVGQLLEAARRPAVSALQVDFDATRSQRAFYSALLADLRRQLPATMPLSITALASWCSSDDWIGALPVDEAVPMFFRMEPGRNPVEPDRPALRIREPLCMSSAGISTRERWPENLAGKRVYVFPDRGWRQDLAYLAARQQDPQGARP
jgi:hypothetical protein